jgi:hypothetical protein
MTGPPDHPCDASCKKVPPDASQNLEPPPQPTEKEELKTSLIIIPHTPTRCVTRVGRLTGLEKPAPAAYAVEYVRGEVHTNGLENFRSLLKRGINGTYVSVELFHPFRYLDEHAFRYNNRNGFTDKDRFDLAVCQIVGKRLTFDRLTRKDQPQWA